MRICFKHMWSKVLFFFNLDFAHTLQTVAPNMQQ